MYKLALIIDDDPISILVCETLLRKLNFVEKIITFKNAEQGLAFLAEHIRTGNEIPDFIFLDLQMPVMNGWEFLEAYGAFDAIASAPPHVVMLSAAFDPNDTLKAESKSVVRKFLAKPITSQALENLRAGT